MFEMRTLTELTIYEIPSVFRRAGRSLFVYSVANLISRLHV